ncbi:MAG TPA: porin family protein [Flavobacterium sp.]|jgi:hypothetical protein
MRLLLRALFLLLTFASFSQQKEVPDFTAVDSLYREDQFYFAFTYNILSNPENGIKQNKFSAGFSGGFLRDMPLNKSRTFAIAAGLGYSLQNYNYNLKVDDASGTPIYSLIEPGDTYDKNKLSLHFVDLPIEFRWRTSAPDSHRFWRVYTGIKLSYLFFDRSRFVDGDEEIIVSGNKDLNSFRYGAYLATGYNTWNAYVYYGLNPIFTNARLNGRSVDLQTINIGLMFYIL